MHSWKPFAFVLTFKSLRGFPRTIKRGTGLSLLLQEFDGTIYWHPVYTFWHFDDSFSQRSYKQITFEFDEKSLLVVAGTERRHVEVIQALVSSWPSADTSGRLKDASRDSSLIHLLFIYFARIVLCSSLRNRPPTRAILPTIADALYWDMLHLPKMRMP